jgi:hypothetical protein
VKYNSEAVRHVKASRMLQGTPPVPFSDWMTRALVPVSKSTSSLEPPGEAGDTQEEAA